MFQLSWSTLSLGSDGKFIRREAELPGGKLTVSICCRCGEYVCATPNESQIEAIERTHACPGVLDIRKSA